MTSEVRTSVMLVDDHSIMRDLLRDALENTGEFRVVAEAADGLDALGVVVEAAPDVVVMDVVMPVMDGIEACRQITDLLPETRVLMLTASNEPDTIVRSIAAGATGYLQKYSGKEQLLATLRGGGPGRVPHPGGCGEAVGPGGANPVGRRLDGTVGNPDGTGEGDPQIVLRGADLPGDWGDEGKQRADGS